MKKIRKKVSKKDARDQSSDKEEEFLSVDQEPESEPEEAPEKIESEPGQELLTTRTVKKVESVSNIFSLLDDDVRPL